MMGDVLIPLCGFFSLVERNTVSCTAQCLKSCCGLDFARCMFTAFMLSLTIFCVQDGPGFCVL